MRKSQGDFAAGKHFCQVPAAASKSVAVWGRGGGAGGMEPLLVRSIVAQRLATAVGSRWGNTSGFGKRRGEHVSEREGSGKAAFKG